VTEQFPLSDDPNVLRQQRKFLYDVEQAVRDANRAIIHERIQKLDKATFVRLAKVVATYRAAYLTKALEFANHPLTPHQMAELKSLREQFEESRHAFDALHRAIVRGYVDLAE
jgi:16S rRNA G527 N7-methylase RsmG